jgi:DNA polymerase-4
VNRAILHIDMDAFYASVEQRDDPRLRGKPLIVGGHARRGVVLAASYEVRPYGVRSAIPMARAVQLAPHAIVVPPRFEAYEQASEQVFAIFESYTPLIEPLSLDEAFLDVTASVGLFGAPSVIAAKIRERIAREVGLPSSAGIASVKFAAKLISDFAKPNGQREVSAGELQAFLAPLPLSRLWGVGPKAEQTLAGLGLRTIGELAARDPEWLEKRLGSAGPHLWRLAHGLDEREVVPDREAKSVGAEDTFEEDVFDRDELRAHVHSQALRVGRRLRRAAVKSRVVQLKVKFADFEVITRRTTLPASTDDGQAIYRAALELLDRVVDPRKIRLTGVSAQDLQRGGGQLQLFAPAPRKSDALNKALDRIAARYGTAAVLTADLVRGEPEQEPGEAGRKAGASRLDPKRGR